MAAGDGLSRHVGVDVGEARAGTSKVRPEATGGGGGGGGSFAPAPAPVYVTWCYCAGELSGTRCWLLVLD
uniref:Uncharacterized protein n=1 Tax=Arundo donax TaxID=35708 RepID=A0A0A9ATE4_ARUDO